MSDTMNEAAGAVEQSLKRSLEETPSPSIVPPANVPEVSNDLPAPANAEGMAIVNSASGTAGGVSAAEEEAADAPPAEGAPPKVAAAEVKPPPAKKRRKYKTRAKSAASWNDMLFELIKFKAQHGHCRVPGAKSPLGSWVAAQRQSYHALRAKQQVDGNPAAVAMHPEGNAVVDARQGKGRGEQLNEERIAVLNSVGFVWDVMQFDHDKRWMKRYEELQEYVRANGHTVVPQSTPLGLWVKMQRENKKEADLKAAGIRANRAKQRPCLSKEREAKLNALGFVWKVARPPVGWEKRFQQLLEYQRLHGDCNVPQSYPPDKSFGRWVMKQRCEYSLRLRGKKSQLTDEREARLNAIGFSWVAPNFKRKSLPELDHHHHLGDDVIDRDEGLALLAAGTTGI